MAMSVSQPAAASTVSTSVIFARFCPSLGFIIRHTFLQRIAFPLLFCHTSSYNLCTFQEVSYEVQFGLLSMLLTSPTSNLHHLTPNAYHPEQEDIYHPPALSGQLQACRFSTRAL